MLILLANRFRLRTSTIFVFRLTCTLRKASAHPIMFLGSLNGTGDTHETLGTVPKTVMGPQVCH